MSFLYQALIKDKPKNNQASHQQYEQPAAGFYGQHFAPEEKSPVILWGIIGALLLVVGLLAGYILGQTPSANMLMTDSRASQSVTQVLEAAPQQDEITTAVVAKSDPTASVDNFEETLPVSDEKLEQKTSFTENDNAENTPQIEVALASDGQVKTKVTRATITDDVEPTPVQNATYSPESQNANESVVESETPELSLDEIPESLKSRFADALKATEDKIEPELFESHVNTGSSLPLISELPANQMYLLPDIEYQMHIFASEPTERWIRVNGQTLLEGDEFNDGLTLLEIRQEQIIWQYKSRRFAQNALEDFNKLSHL